MIALHDEHLLALREVPGFLPRRPNGKKLHLSAVYRWVRGGVSGVVLESVRVGGTTYTSAEALQRFSQRLSSPVAAPPPGPAQFNQQAERANLLLLHKLEGRRVRKSG